MMRAWIRFIVFGEGGNEISGSKKGEEFLD
jgi:hypothetical protein